LADPIGGVILPVSFQLALASAHGRGLVKAFRYGLVMPGGPGSCRSDRPARIATPTCWTRQRPAAALVLEFEEIDRTTFVQSLSAENRPELRRRSRTPPLPCSALEAARRQARRFVDGGRDRDRRGHGGIDNGTQSNGESEKNLVLGFALALRDRIEKAANIGSS